MVVLLLLACIGSVLCTCPRANATFALPNNVRGGFGLFRSLGAVSRARSPVACRFCLGRISGPTATDSIERNPSGVGGGGRPSSLQASRGSTTETRVAVARRAFLRASAIHLSGPILPASATMENAPNVFAVGKALTLPEAETRFQEGQKTVQYLLDNFDSIAERGGDEVRRYLGTVGTTSGLFGISKVMKVLMERADDVVEYTETMNEVNKSIQQADGSAYMAIFVTTSTSYTPPAKYFGDAKIEVQSCIKAMDELAEIIDLKL